jgi:hypothetical protein
MLAPPAPQINLPALVSQDLAAAKRRTQVAILLPSTAPARGDVATIHGTGYGRRTHYAFTFFYGETCGADACSLGYVSGAKNHHPDFTTTTKLAGGRTGYYKGWTCGGSCSPPEIEWLRRGVLYSIQWGGAPQAGARGAMVRLANSALAAGPR